jgi:prepilin-type N-terminal cleavage/methylation domain-containing protein
MGYARKAAMKTHLQILNRTPVAFTLLELMVVIALLAILVALMPCSASSSKTRAQRINCVNNLKQVGLSFRLWAGDNGDKYPMAVSTNVGGTMELVAAGAIYPHFTAMSNELGTPKIIRCPSDDRNSATNFTSLSDSNISYFVCLNATNELNPDMWLAGDRNLTNGSALVQGALMVPTNSPAGWTEKLHKLQGNLALADGSVQQLTSQRLRELLRSQTDSPLRLAMPQ